MIQHAWGTILEYAKMNKAYSGALVVVLEEALVVVVDALALVVELVGWCSTLPSQNDFSKTSLRPKGLRKDQYIYIY